LSVSPAASVKALDGCDHKKAAATVTAAATTKKKTCQKEHNIKTMHADD
jgi:hypothetical protein